MDSFKPQQTQQENRKNISTSLSRMVITKEVMSPHLPGFVATLVYSIWHGCSFRTMVLYPTSNLRHFTQFIRNILGVTAMPFSVLLLALYYIHLIKMRRPHLKGAEGSEFRLIICTMMLSMKYLMDNNYSNQTWHKVSEIPLSEINITEHEFLVQMDFDINVAEDVYFEWVAYIEDSVSSYKQLISCAQSAHPPSPVASLSSRDSPSPRSHETSNTNSIPDKRIHNRQRLVPIETSFKSSAFPYPSPIEDQQQASHKARPRHSRSLSSISAYEMSIDNLINR